MLLDLCVCALIPMWTLFLCVCSWWWWWWFVACYALYPNVQFSLSYRFSRRHCHFLSPSTMSAKPYVVVAKQSPDIRIHDKRSKKEWKINEGENKNVLNMIIAYYVIKRKEEKIECRITSLATTTNSILINFLLKISWKLSTSIRTDDMTTRVRASARRI